MPARPCAPERALYPEYERNDLWAWPSPSMCSLGGEGVKGVWRFIVDDNVQKAPEPWRHVAHYYQQGSPFWPSAFDPARAEASALLC